MRPPSLDGLLANVERAIPIMAIGGHINPLQYRPQTRRRTYPHSFNKPKSVYRYYEPVKPPAPFRDALSEKMLTHIYDIMGLTQKGDLPLYRCVVFISALYLDGNELYHFDGLCRENGLFLTSIKREFVAYIGKKSKLKYSKLLSFYKYADYFITCTDNSVDPVEVLKRVDRVIKAPVAVPLIQVNSLPIKKRFVMAGARLDYDVFNLDRLDGLLKTPSREELMGQLSMSLDHNVRKISSNIASPVTELARSLDHLEKQ